MAARVIRQRWVSDHEASAPNAAVRARVKQMRSAMSSRQTVWIIALVAVLTLATLGCSQVTGPGGATRLKEPAPEPGQPQETSGLELRRNPLYQPTDERRQGEPEYIWVETNQPFYKDPPTLNRLIFGKEAELAPREVQERLEHTRPGGPRPAGTVPAIAKTEPATSGEAALSVPSVLGYVVDVRGRRLYTDLTLKEGLDIGSTLVILREVGELKHPITGKSLGQADEEIGIARVVELRAGFSVAEIIELKPGQEVRIKDRVRAGTDR
jgi:hypothetical protein